MRWKSKFFYTFLLSGQVDIKYSLDVFFKLKSSPEVLQLQNQDVQARVEKCLSLS